MSEKEYYVPSYWGRGLGDYIYVVHNCMCRNNNNKKEELNLLVNNNVKILKTGSSIETAENFVLNFFDTNIKKINYINDKNIKETPTTHRNNIGCKPEFLHKNSNKNYFCYSSLSFHSPLIPNQLQSKFISICQEKNVKPICVDYPMPLFEAINLIINSVGLFTPHSGLYNIANFCKTPMAVYIPIPPKEHIFLDKNNKLHKGFSELKDMHIVETMIKNSRERII